MVCSVKYGEYDFGKVQKFLVAGRYIISLKNYKNL